MRFGFLHRLEYLALYSRDFERGRPLLTEAVDPFMDYAEM